MLIMFLFSYLPLNEPEFCWPVREHKFCGNYEYWYISCPIRRKKIRFRNFRSNVLFIVLNISSFQVFVKLWLKVKSYSRPVTDNKLGNGPSRQESSFSCTVALHTVPQGFTHCQRNNMITFKTDLGASSCLLILIYSLFK